MFALWDTEERINYQAMASKLFPDGSAQQIVPFLGAGVSVSARPPMYEDPKPEYPSAEIMKQITKLLGMAGEPTAILEYAIRVAVWIDAWQKKNGVEIAADRLLQQLVDNPYPPFAWELAEVISYWANYTALADRPLASVKRRQFLPADRIEREPLVVMFKLLCRATDLGNSSDPLASIASYHQTGADRAELWKGLKQIISNKERPTAAHELIADAAARQLPKEDAEDYLIITTNYDCLMERALDARDLPYIVLWWSRDRRIVRRRVCNLPKERLERVEQRSPEAAPEHFRIESRQPLAIVYKMHGCLDPRLGDSDDGLVITEGDYVDFIANIDRMIPAHVGSILPQKRLLFLGYSFNDWNVRAIYESTIRRTAKAKSTQDYAVTKSLSAFEEAYFRTRDIVIALIDLETFSAGIRRKSSLPQ